MKDLEGQPGIHIKELDVRHDEAVNSVVDAVIQEQGQLDIVVRFLYLPPFISKAGSSTPSGFKCRLSQQRAAP